MNRRDFFKQLAIIGAGIALSPAVKWIVASQRNNHRNGETGITLDNCTFHWDKGSSLDGMIIENCTFDWVQFHEDGFTTNLS